jgi:proprotein convertase subtilisin/kexin type 5
MVAFLSFGHCKQSAVYLNQFAVHIPSGQEAADDIARKHGFTNLGQVSHSLE